MCKLLFFILIFVISCNPYVSDKPQDPEYEAAMQTTGYLSPKAALFQLLSYACKNNYNCDDTEYGLEVREIKRKILSHDLTIHSTESYLDELLSRERPLEFSDKIDELLQRLMPDPDYRSLWNDFHGRAFDSNLINYLILNPPQDVAIAMEKYGLYLSHYLTNLINLELISKSALDERIFKMLTKNEFRFWLKSIPEFKTIMEEGPENAVDHIFNFLNRPINRGVELIARPYLVVKIGYALEKIGQKPSYFTLSNPFYDDLHYLAKLVRVNVNGGSADHSPQAGLALPGHPPLISESWMESSTRPTAVRFPKLSGFSSRKEKLARDTLFYQLENGVTWASGFSGSTSYNLHAWKDAVTNTNPELIEEIDLHSFILGVTMFMVYDGGHSIFEVLWCANEFVSKNDFELKFGSGDNIHTFLSDFNVLLDNFAGSSTHESLKRAYSHSFAKTIELSLTISHEPVTTMKLSGARES